MIPLLAAHLLQSTYFAVAAGLLTIAFRKNGAHVRYWLWLSASLKFLVPFALLMDLGSHLKWASAAQRIATQIAAPAVSYTLEQFSRPTFTDTLQPAPAAPSEIHWMTGAIAVTWLCGFLSIALIRFRSWLRIRAAVRASNSSELSTSTPVEVRVSSGPSGLLEPGVFGGVIGMHPVILLPEGITQRLTPAELKAILAHELCHVRRRDNLLAAIHMIVETVFWFYPLVWWIGSRLVAERESACDEEVLSLGNQPDVYADAILTVCKLYVETPLACVSGVTGASIRRRIESIMINPGTEGLNRSKKLLLAGAGLAALAGPVVIGMAVGVSNAHATRAQSQVAQVRQATLATTSAPLAPGRDIAGTIEPTPPVTLAQVRPQQAPTSGAPQTPAKSAPNIEFGVAPVPVDFEVASVKQGISYSEWVARIRHMGTVQAPWGIKVSGRRVHVEGISMKGLISEAYGIDTRLIAGPSWVTDGDITYEVDALMPDGVTEGQLPAMFQSLLAGRFHLGFHRETVPQLGYALVRSKGELKLRPPGSIDPSACPEWQSYGDAADSYQSCRRLDTLGDERVQTVIWQNSVFGPNTRQMHGMEWHDEFYRITMQQLAGLASTRIGSSPAGAINGPEAGPGPMTTVVDRTGLEGQWRIIIDQEMGAETRLPSLIASLNRLGLGLERMQVPVEKIVIDRVDKDPTPN